MRGRVLSALLAFWLCYLGTVTRCGGCNMSSPAAVASIDPAALNARMAEDEADYQTLVAWARVVVPGFRLWPHTEKILRAIAPAIRGVPLRTWLCVPPRFGKTECALILASYLICKYPVAIGYVAYGDDLAVDASERCQAMVRLAGYDLVRGRQRKKAWAVQGGGKWYSGGIGSAWHGKGLDLVLADDLLKGSDESRNGDLRDKVWRRFLRDIDSRRDRKDASAIVGIGTRWHADDPGGRVIAGHFKEKFNVIVLPAANDNGDALCHEVLPISELLLIKERDLAGYWSLYMQDPRPDGESIFRLRAVPMLERDAWQSDGKRLAMFCDPAATAKTSSDNCAFGVCAMDGFGDASVMDVVEATHTRLPPEQLAEALVTMWRSWGSCLPVFIEAIGVGAFLPTTIKAMCPEISAFVFPIVSTPQVKLTSDKYARAQPVARAFNAARVRFVIGPWLGAGLAEIWAFTGLDDPHDDFVDFIAHAFNTLYEGAPDEDRGESDSPDLAYDDYGEDAA